MYRGDSLTAWRRAPALTPTLPGREASKGVEIRHIEKVDILMNSKLDHYAPAVGRMVMEREVGGRGERGGV